MSQSPRRSPRKHTSMLSSAGKKKKTAERVDKPPSFNPPHCEGAFYIDKYLPEHDGRPWTGKERFLVHVKAVVKFITKAQKNGDKNQTVTVASGKKFQCMYCYIIFNIPGVLLSRDTCESKDSSGQSIRWLKDYPDHYIKKHNVVPTERFFTFIEGMYRKIKTNKVSKR